MAGNSNGIQLPVSLQISNLQDIANQLKQFANKNVLADSLGGKKIDSELSKILSRLEQISAKSKTAFTTQADFTSVQKEIDSIEIGLNKVQGTIKNLDFSELKIPEEFSGQVAALQGRIRELNGSLMAFKGTQKEKLVSNVDFMADLQTADPKQAAKWLEKGYDELYKSINEGMTKVNTQLALKAAEFKRQQEVITQNSKGKTSMTQWGALQFIQDAFKTLPKDDSQRNSAQQLMSEFMKTAQNDAGKMEFTGFQRGAVGLNGFLQSIQKQFEFTPEQMTDIRARLKEQVESIAKEGKATITDVIRAMGTDESLAKKVFFGDQAQSIELAGKQYATSIRDLQKTLTEKTELEGRSEAFARVKVAFDVPNEEIKQKSAEIAAALKIPEDALKGFEASILSAATKSPQIAALFQRASGEIANLNNAVEQGKQKLQSIDNAINKMQGISNFVNRYVGLYAIVRKVTSAIRNAMTNIKDIDKAITSIAVVTNMSQSDLWGKIGEYTAMAQQYGVATKDVYTVSQIFYQQGLQTSQVMQMTTESLKMAKIAGIDYSTAANAMTVAVRAFKLEMSEAQSVTDTYSALAAKFAVSSSEIANAMEKTASSAASVGMSLQSTSAFISVMEQTTRESAQNIGSALKSIISRYGEMKASPDKLLNVEGEEVAFNKVDTALSSIGISIKDASGQFRDFDDVIMELAKKWDSLDNNTQRYIATIMAGNRQQSRFIALVSNYDELSRAMDTANNSENASIVQVAKTMDSLESKANQLKNAFSQIYLDLRAEEGLKNVYDWLTRILKTISKLGILKGALPTLANVIGLGTGTKSLVNLGKQSLIDSKTKISKKIELDEAEARQKTDKLNEDLSKEIIKQVNIVVDEGKLAEAQTKMELFSNESVMKQANTASSMLAMTSGGLALGNDSIRLGAVMSALQSGQLSDSTSREQFINSMGINKEDQPLVYENLNNALAELANKATEAGIKLGQAGDDAKKMGTDATLAGEKTREAGDANSDASEKVREHGDASSEASGKVRSDGDAHSDTEGKVRSEGEAHSDTEVKVRSEGDTHQQTEGQVRSEGDTHQQTEGQVRSEGDAHQQTEGQVNNLGIQSSITAPEVKDVGDKSGEAAPKIQNLGDSAGNKGNSSAGGWAGHDTARKVTGALTGVARIAGTAITAAGAAHQDKSTDKQETSKLLTGLGNGLSMAGTGASMGMAFGPWGAAIGAIGGFLVGGLGAIIDGATMTLEERMALEKEEAKKASDEALKASAKATDVSTQLENLKTLRKNMHNSTEDMQAYTDAMNTMASQYPELVSAYDSAGNAIINLQSAEEYLATTRAQASTAAREAAVAEAKVRRTQIEILNDFDDEMQKMVSGGTTLRNQSENMGVNHTSTAFLLQTGTGESGKNGVRTYAITGDEHVNITGGRGYGTQSNAGSEFMHAFNALRNSKIAEEDSEIGKILRYYNEHPEEHLSTENFKIIGQYILDHTTDAVSRGGYGVPSKFIVAGSQMEDVTFTSKDNLQRFIEQDVTAPEASYKYGKTDIIDKINKFLDTNGEALGISQKTAQEYFGWTDLDSVDLDVIMDGWRKLQAMGERYNRQAKILDKNVTRAYAQEEIDTSLTFSDMSSSRQASISGSKVFSSILAQGLENAATEIGMENAAAWSEDEKLGGAFVVKKQELAQQIFDWIGTLTDNQLQSFIEDSTQMDSFLSADEIIAKYHIDDPELQKAIIDQFIESNSANKNRILNAIYTTDAKGNRYSSLNSSMKGLAKFNYETQRYNGSTLETVTRNDAQDIADRFGANKILSKYSDYFMTQLSNINQLAEDGYTEIAHNRLNILNQLSSYLTELSSEDQNAIFGTVTSIDFSSYDSIKAGRKKLFDWAQKTGKMDIVQPFLDTLDDAANLLVFNVNTLASELSTKVRATAKEINSILATNKTGMDLDKSLEELEKINASSADGKQFSFNEIFRYDAALGKYVYTAKGLETVLAQKETDLEDSAKKLAQTSKIMKDTVVPTVQDWSQQKGAISTSYSIKYRTFNNTEEMTQDQMQEYLEKQGYETNNVKTILSYAYNQSQKEKMTMGEIKQFMPADHSQKFESKDQMKDWVKSQDNYDQQYAQQYETLVEGFWNAAEYTEKTEEAFIAYVEQEAAKGNEAAERAKQEYEAYQANKANQMFQNIDWVKLATNTDFSGINEAYKEQLIGEINKDRKEKYGDHAHLMEAGADWDEVLDAYLWKLYGDEENAAELVENAKLSILGNIKTSKSNQVSTAIGEVLKGAGAPLSETTIGLLKEKNKFKGLVTSSGVLVAGQDYVQSAIDLFNESADQFQTLTERNQAYMEIIQAAFAPAKATKSLASSGGTIDIESMGGVFDAYNMEIDNFFDAKTKQWKNGAENVFSTDMFGETTILDWDKFMEFIPEDQREAFKQSPYYNEWYNSFVQGGLDRKNKPKTAKQTALNNYSSAKEGEDVNVSQMPDEVKKMLGISGDTVEAISEQDRDNKLMAIDAATIDDEDVKRWVLDSQKNIRSKRGSQVSTFQSVIKDKVSESEARAFSMAWTGTDENWKKWMEDLGFVWNDKLQQFLATEQVTADKIHTIIESNKDNWTSEEYNNALVLEKNLRDLEKNKPINALRDLLSNYTNVTNEIIGAFETEFPNIDLDEFIIDKNGKKELDIAALRKAHPEIAKIIDENLSEEMSAIVEDRLDYISQAASLTSSGTTSAADMATFTKKYNDLMGTSLSQGDLFSYDDVLDAFTIKPEFIQAYVQKQKEQLIALGWNETDINKYIQSTTTKSFASAIDISGFIGAENTGAGSQARKQIVSQLGGFRGVTHGQKVSEDWRDYHSANVAAVQAEHPEWQIDSDEMIAEVTKRNNEAVEQAKAANKSIAQSNTEWATKLGKFYDMTDEELANILESGGEDAVELSKIIAESAGTELSSDEIESIYRAKVNKLTEAAEQANDITVGSIISTNSKLYEVLKELHMVDDKGVITSTKNMASVYKKIYDQMKETNEKTTSDLNTVYAQYLTANDQKDIDTLDALENASGMTYDAMGQILSKYGKSLEDFMANPAAHGIESAGFGKVRITDWDTFAKAVGLSDIDMNTPEYMEAYSSWVDARVKFENNEKTRVEDAVEELKGLTEAKPGEAINVSHLESVMGDSLQTIAEKYGATLKDGMLIIGEHTNIPGLIKDIADEAARTGKMIPEQLAEVADAVEGMLSSITDLINDGIQGKLNNVDAVKLQKWASENGIGQLDFIKTAEGLKLSESSAITLYNTLKKVDSLQASLVFDNLRESLEATNDNFKDTQSLMTHINKIRNGTYAADDKVSSARLRQYESELEVAEEILAIRSTSEDSSFDFMNKSIPAGQNNPITYMENWATAYEKMKATTKGGKDSKGLMEYTDFYNIITEMGHIAEMSGQAITLGKETVSNSEEAAALITKAAGALKVTSDGKMKVDLSGIGVEFKTGADKMSSDVNAGIDAVADAQIEMLDSLISLLEVVVAMEQLGDLDLNGDNHINLDEIFEVDGDGQPIYDAEKKTYKLKDSYKNICKNIIEMADANGGDNDLNRALNSVRVNGVTMRQIFEEGAQGIMNSNFSFEEYQQAVDAFYQMAISDDYDLDNIAESVQKIFADSGLKNISIDVGTKTFFLQGDFKYLIDWSKEDAINAAVEAIKKWGPDFLDGIDLSTDEGVRQAITKIVEQRANNKDLTVEDQANIDYTLGLAAGEIVIDEKKGKDGKYSGSYKGKTFKSDSKQGVEDKIKQALRYENDGFLFNVEDSGEVTGTLALNGAKIEVKQVNGKDEYTAVSSTGQRREGFATKDEALDWLVLQGDGDKGTRKIDGQVYNVFVDANTNVSYTLMPDNSYMCEGHSFATWEDLQKYLAYKKLSKGGEVERNDHEEITVKGKAKLTYNFDSNEAKYEYMGPDGQYHSFNSPEDYEQYLAAYEFSDGHVNNSGNVEYEVDGMMVEVQVDTTGKTSFHVQLPNGDELISSTDAGIRQAIADYNYINGGEATSSGKKISYTVKKANGATITVDYSATGVNITQNGQNDPDLEKKLNEKWQAEVDKTNPKATSSKVDVDASAATVGVDLGENPTVTDTIPTITAKVAQVLLDASGITPSITNLSTNATVGAEGVIGTILGAAGLGYTPTVAVSSVQLDASGAANTISGLSATATVGGVIGAVLGAVGLGYTPTVAVSNVNLDASGATNSIAPNADATPNEGYTPNVSVSAVNITPAQGASGTLTSAPESVTYNDTIEVSAASINVNSDNVDASGIGDKIAEQIQAALDGHEIKPNVTAPDVSANLTIPDFSGSVSQLETIATTLSGISDEGINAVKTAADNITADKVNEIESAQRKIGHDKVDEIETAQRRIGHGNVDEIESAQRRIGHGNVDEIESAQRRIGHGNVDEIESAQRRIGHSSVDAIDEAQRRIGHEQVDAIRTAESNISTSSITAVQNALNNIRARVTGSSDSGTVRVRINVSRAKGNIGAFAKGNVALAGGTQTLMGELGPELVVSQGRYFLVGQNGAEFVDLDKDAIVFNHKQTERLLSQGGIGSRGVPFTNEQNAISYAKGNVTGPAKDDGDSFSWNIDNYYWTSNYRTERDFTVGRVGIDGFSVAKGNLKSSLSGLALVGGQAMASASAALAALKQLRSMWQSIKKASAKDLAGLGGGGGGGGGDGTNKYFTKELQKWYNWLQQIDKLEASINRQEAWRNKLSSDNAKNGLAYYTSQKNSLKALKSEIAVTQDLMLAQQDYFKKRQDELNHHNGPFSSLYNFDNDGQLIYNSKKKDYTINGKKKKMTGFEFLSKLSGKNSETNQPNFTAKQQYEILVANGFGSYLKYDSSGNPIEYKDGKPKDDSAYQSAVQAFWDKIDADKEEMQSLHDSIDEYDQKILELQEQENEILQEIQDNQMEVENSLMSALQEVKQRTIDNLQDLRDAYSEASEDLISGLTEALNKERDQYEKNEDDAELLQLRRRLALLQRSGGSASEIANLQSEIKSKSKDIYFNEQERQIEAIQTAADKQTARLDTQIDIATKSLEYQKKYGLLWTEISDMMQNWTPEQLVSYLKQNTEDFWGKSKLAKSETANDWLFEATQWTAYRDDLKKGTDDAIKLLKKLASSNPTESAEADFEASMRQVYGNSWNNLSSADKERARSAFRDEFNLTGDYKSAVNKARDTLSDRLHTSSEQASHKWVAAKDKNGNWYMKQDDAKGKSATDAAKEVKENNAWEEAQASYRSKYGNSWNTLTSSQKKTIEQAVKEKASATTTEARDAAQKKIDQALASSTNSGGSLQTEDERKKKQYVLEKQNDGTYKIVKKEGAGNATDYNTAYNKMLEDNAWVKAQDEYQRKYKKSWNTLSAEQKSKIEQAVRNKALGKGTQADIDNALKAATNGGASLQTADERAKKQYTVKQNKDGTYTIKKVKEGSKGAVNYDSAYKQMQHNNNRLKAWQAYETKLSQTYGATYTNLDASRKAKIKEQYFAAYDKNPGQVTDKQALAGQTAFLGTTTQQAYSGTGTQKYGWTYVKNAETGKYEAKRVAKEGYSGKLTNYATALKNAQRTNAWNTLVASYGVSWNMLTADQKKKYKSIYDKAYNAASTNPSQAAQKALEADADFKKNFLTAKSKKEWSIYQKDDNTKWVVKKITDAKVLKTGKTPKSKKTITTYANAYNDVTANNKLFAQYQQDKKKDPKTKVPKYQIRYKYDRGGMVESTGAALLHAKESVLTAQQTDILRNDILGKQNNSLLNLLLDFKRAYNNIGASTVSTEPSIIIENASVNMNVASIANDYDAKRAGEQALSEMLKIARKKGAASTLRR